MSKYTINGLDTDWPGIPYPIVETYNPTPYTHMYLWRAMEPAGHLFIVAHLDMLQLIKAISRLRYMDFGRGTTLALFDYTGGATTTYTLDAIEKYGSILCGTNHYLSCPARQAEHALHNHTIDIIQQGMNAATYSARIHGVDTTKSEPVLKHMEEEIDEASKKAAATAGRHAGTPAAHDGQQSITLTEK